MPTYEYECEECEHKFEEFHSIKEMRKKCPECGKKKLRRLFGVPALVFKGPGFYVNDYKKQESP